jgi:hypothetical protein
MPANLASDDRLSRGPVLAVAPARRTIGMMARAAVEIPKSAVAEFCRRHRIRQLALFGSVLRADFRPDSDIDVLVEFERGHTPGLITMAAIEIEFSGILGRKADLRTAGDLSKYFRDEVIRTAEVKYSAG